MRPTVVIRADGASGSVHIQADPTSTVENITVGDKVYSGRAGKVTVRDRRATRPLWQRLLLAGLLWSVFVGVFVHTVSSVIIALLRQ